MIEVKLQQSYAGFDLGIEFCTQTRHLALFGHSGSGKTTILQAIAGLLRPRSGYISLNGEVLLDSHRNIFVPTYKRHIGYLFQDGRLFPHLNVWHNLTYGNRYRPNTSSIVTADAVIELLNLSPLLKRRVQALSGGEAKRVAIGRALLSNPTVLLLDEPTVGLHQSACEQIILYLRSIRKEIGMPMIVVSHVFRDVIALADEVVILNNGAVIAQEAIAQFVDRAKQSADSSP